MRIQHRNLTKRTPENKSNSVDLWLTRLSHLSQLGLLAVAVIGYFYTVVPLYQKAVLDEDIAKKELELKSNKKALEENYVELRKIAVVFSAGLDCTDIRSPVPLSSIPKLNPIVVLKQNLETEVPPCLHKIFGNAGGLTYLRKADYTFLSQRVDDLGNELEKMRRRP